MFCPDIDNREGSIIVHILINTLRPKQNGRHFADDIFKWIFLNENIWIPIIISMMVRLPTHKCVTRPQRVNAAQIVLFHNNLPLAVSSPDTVN